MSVASVSGRLRAQRLASEPGSIERRKVAAKIASAYTRAWRKAGCPDWPSVHEHVMAQLAKRGLA